MPSGFVAHSPTPMSAEVGNDGFFPNIALADFASAMRLDGTITEAQQRYAVTLAINNVNRDLIGVFKRLPGTSLAEVDPEKTIDNIPVLVRDYEEAVYCRARALLTEQYRDFDSTDSGHKRADALEPSVDDYLRRSREAIRRLRGLNRVTVELI